MEHIGNIIVSRKNKAIAKLYKSKDIYYVLDVVLNTSYNVNFMEYYAYEVSLENIQNFIEKKKNEYLLPRKNQMIYRVHFFDFQIQEVLKYKKSLNDNLSFFDEEFECAEMDKIKKHLEIKTEENELSKSI